MSLIRSIDLHGNSKICGSEPRGMRPGTVIFGGEDKQSPEWALLRKVIKSLFWAEPPPVYGPQGIGTIEVGDQKSVLGGAPPVYGPQGIVTIEFFHGPSHQPTPRYGARGNLKSWVAPQQSVIIGAAGCHARDVSSGSFYISSLSFITSFGIISDVCTTQSDPLRLNGGPGCDSPFFIPFNSAPKLGSSKRWYIGWDTASPVERKSKAELEVEMLRKVARCLTEAAVSKDGEIANLDYALKKLQIKLKVQERDIREYTYHLTKQREEIMLLEVRERETREYTDHLAKQGQVIEKQREEIMLLVATAKKTKESQTESVEEVKKKTVWQGQDACCQTTTEGCTSMSVQEMAFQNESEEKVKESFVEADPEEVRDDACCQAVVLTVQEMVCKTEPDSNPNTTLVGHEAGSQTPADTIIRAAATPSRKEMASQTDVEHVCKASVQNVACQSACLVQNTSQAPLDLTAAQPGLADADKMVIIKMDLHIMRKMQLVKAERLVEAEEKNIELAALAKEYRT
eukprot:gene13386-19235_t